MTNTPVRSFRIPDPIWDPARDKAKDRGETLTDVVVRALREYVEED